MEYSQTFNHNSNNNQNFMVLILILMEYSQTGEIIMDGNNVRVS